MFGTRGNGGAAGTGGNDLVVPQITQPTQAELDATADALANQQEMTRAMSFVLSYDPLFGKFLESMYHRRILCTWWYPRYSSSK